MKLDNMPNMENLESKDSNVERLESLSYISWAPIREENKEKKGVVKYDSNLSYDGINLYNSDSSHLAYLINMYGRKIHEWQLGMYDSDIVTMDENGNLFFLSRDVMLSKIDWNSNLIWKNKARFHHYLDLTENGDIYSLTRRRIKIQYKNQLIPILNDFIIILSPEGKVKKEVSIFELFWKRIPRKRLNDIFKIIQNNDISAVVQEEDTPLDVFHTNSVEVINRDIEGLCKKGDVLISIRELNLIAIIDIEKEKVVWDWGKDDLDGQHAPTLLKNGNILIFDNGRYKRKYSRVIELNPATKEIVWEYKAKPPASFFSELRGRCQKLPNGNVLIMESDSGHVFEITMDNKLVWEFYNPLIKEDKDGVILRAIIPRMERLSLGALRVIQQ